jgi:amidase
MGLQILAPYHGDLACLQFAYAYEQVTQWSSIRPSEAIVTTGQQTNGCACV